jgi:hypothetical protein
MRKSGISLDSTKNKVGLKKVEYTTTKDIFKNMRKYGNPKT